MRYVPHLVALFSVIAVSAVSRADGGKTTGDRPPEERYTQTIPGTEISFDMIPIPAGKSLIGSPADEAGRQPDEGPRFEVHVDAMWMGKTVVTWPEYNAFCGNWYRLTYSGPVEIPKDRWADAVSYPTPVCENATVNDANVIRMGEGKDFPAVSMAQYAARQYTKWLSKKTGRFYRLPTEAEWEYACRGGSTTAFNFGDDPAELKRHAWFLDNSNLKDGDPSYHKVASMAPNAWGLFDMHGNVGQWCIDQYDPAWYARFKGKSIDWRDCINWPTTRYPIVIRGGGYESEAAECRSSARLHSNKGLNDELPGGEHWEFDGLWFGFRLVRPAKEPNEAEKQRFWDDPDAATKAMIRTPHQGIHELITPAKD